MLEELVLKRKRGEGTPKRPECLSSDFDEDEEDRETEARVVKKRFPSGLGVPSTLRPTTFSSPSVGTNVQPSIFIKKPAVDWSSVPLGRSSSSMNTSQSQPTPAPASREISIEASKLINSDYAHHIFGGKQRTRRRRRHKPSNASYSDSKDRRSTQGLRHAGHAESHERTSISESERHALTTLNEERAFANSLHGSAPALSGNGESHEEYDTEASESDSEDSDASYSSFPPDDDRSMISNATRRDDENDENVLISPMPPPDPPKDDIPTTPDDPEKRMPNVPLSLVCPQWPRSLPKAGRVRSDGPPRYYPTREAEKAEATMASLITKSFEAQDTYDRINEIISAGAADSMELSGRPVDPQTNPATTSKILEPVSPEALEATYPSNPQREGADQEELKDSSRKTSPVPTPSHSEAMSDGLSSDRTLTPRPSERRKTALPSSLQVTLPHHSKHDLQLGDVSSPLDTVSRRSLAEFSDANTYRHLSTMQADALKEQRVAAKSTKRAPPLQENEPNKSESVVHCEPETGPRSEYPMVSSTQNQSPLLSVEVHQGLSVKLVVILRDKRQSDLPPVRLKTTLPTLPKVDDEDPLEVSTRSLTSAIQNTPSKVIGSGRLFCETPDPETGEIFRQAILLIRKNEVTECPEGDTVEVPASKRLNIIIEPLPTGSENITVGSSGPTTSEHSDRSPPQMPLTIKSDAPCQLPARNESCEPILVDEEPGLSKSMPVQPQVQVTSEASEKSGTTRDDKGDATVQVGLYVQRIIAQRYPFFATFQRMKGFIKTNEQAVECLRFFDAMVKEFAGQSVPLNEPEIKAIKGKRPSKITKAAVLSACGRKTSWASDCKITLELLDQFGPNGKYPSAEVKKLLGETSGGISAFMHEMKRIQKEHKAHSTNLPGS